MRNILICDDNKAFLKAAGLMLGKYTSMYDISIFAFDNGTDLLEYCYNNKFDVIFMDVDLGKKNGLDIAKELKIINPNYLIIYISAYEIYFEDMVNAEPFAFVNKSHPENLEKELSKALKKAMDRLDPKDIWTYTFGKNEYGISLSRIACFHSLARTIHIVGDIGDAPKYFYGKMDCIENEIREIDKNFIRISKSCIVNKKLSMRCIDYRVKVNDMVFPVTQKYRKAFREEYYW